MGKLVEVREFDSITYNGACRGDKGFTVVTREEFDDLRNLLYASAGTWDMADVLEFMQIRYRRNIGEVISFKNYVGLIQTKKGVQIQILPKISLGDSQDRENKQTKRILIKMLCSMRGVPGKQLNEASLEVERMNLYEIFINMYLQEVHQLVKRGIRSAYVGREDNLRYCKGKLLVGMHVKENRIHQERFYAAYDEFLPDCPENRLVKATLETLKKRTTNVKIVKEILQLLNTFELVEASTNYEKDFSKAVSGRNTRDYDMLMKWSKVFLRNKSFSIFSGDVKSKALLFPMELVYERYVAQEIKKIFAPSGWKVLYQHKGTYLFEEPKKRFELRPDIVLKRGERTIIMDTKWKLLKDNAQENYGISQNDMYQMYVYSKKYQTSETWLLYPVNDEMRDHGEIRFASGEDTVVSIHFVDLANIEDNLGELKCKLSEE